MECGSQGLLCPAPGCSVERSELLQPTLPAKRDDETLLSISWCPLNPLPGLHHFFLTPFLSQMQLHVGKNRQGLTGIILCSFSSLSWLFSKATNTELMSPIPTETQRARGYFYQHCLAISTQKTAFFFFSLKPLLCFTFWKKGKKPQQTLFGWNTGAVWSGVTLFKPRSSWKVAVAPSPCCHVLFCSQSCLEKAPIKKEQQNNF